MFDSHAHVAAAEFNDDRDEARQRALAAGLTGWMEVGTSLADSRAAIAVAEKYEGVAASVGVHPDNILDLTEVDWAQMAAMADHRKVKAIGEVGLDFYRSGKLEEQVPVLRRFIALAVVKKLPVLWHVRSGENLDAHEELLKLLESYSQGERPRGVMHTYSGTVAQMKRYVKLGIFISFSGVLTFKNAGELLEVAKQLPADKMLVETDCPFLTPVPHRGERNEPAYVSLVVAKLAAVRGVEVKEIESQTDSNAQKLFGL